MDIGTHQVITMSIPITQMVLDVFKLRDKKHKKLTDNLPCPGTIITKKKFERKIC